MVLLPLMELPVIPPLVRGEPHIWRCSLELDEQQLKQATAILDVPELERANRFHFARHRNAFIAARAQLRSILGAYLQLPSTAIQFAYGTHGKPLLEPMRHSTEACFNLAHTDRQMVVALTLGQSVGVDCEDIVDNRDHALIARGVFSTAEQARWSQLQGPEALLGFYRCWTRKEAYIKAHGLGLSMPLTSFDVSLGDDAQLVATRPNPTDVDCWKMANVELGAGSVAAVVVEGPLRKLHYLR